MPTPPDQLAGRRIVVTGASAGLGYFTAEQLAGAGASVVLAVRSAERGARAVAAIRERHPDAALEIVLVDLADLDSVAAGAVRLAAEPIDGMVANAGVLPWHRAGPTRQGFEPVFGTNQLGHFALLARTFDALTEHAAVVHLGSLSARGQRLDVEDLLGERGRRHARYTVYGRSKLAVMTTAVELDRRVREAGRSVRSVIAHPGYASPAPGPQRVGITPERSSAVYGYLVSRLANSMEAGAAITVRALVDGRGGELWGPDGWFFGLGGRPVVQRLRGPVTDPTVGARLWSASERLTGVPFRIA